MGQRKKLNCNEASVNPAGCSGANTVLQSHLKWLCLCIPASLSLVVNCPGKSMTLSKAVLWSEMAPCSWGPPWRSCGLATHDCPCFPRTGSRMGIWAVPLHICHRQWCPDPLSHFILTSSFGWLELTLEFPSHLPLLPPPVLLVCFLYSLLS